MKLLVEMIRFCARILATPVFFLAFGFFWLCFLLFLGPVFQIFSFLEGEHFDWRDFLAECDEFFSDPLTRLWKR